MNVENRSASWALWFYRVTLTISLFISLGGGLAGGFYPQEWFRIRSLHSWWLLSILVAPLVALALRFFYPETFSRPRNLILLGLLTVAIFPFPALLMSIFH